MDRSDHGSLIDLFKLFPLLLLLLLLLSSLVGVDMANSPSPSPSSSPSPSPRNNSMFGPFSTQLVTQWPNTTTDPSAFLPLLNSTDLRFTFGWAPIPTNANNNQMNAPSAPNPTLYLLSIIYLPYLAPQQVWTANRDRPVSLGATLTLSSSGTLLLMDSDLSHVWSSSSSSSSSSSYMARHDDLLTLSLLDHGNLVVVANSSSPGGIVWQSFDHPTDTILPGQVISTGMRFVSSVSYGNASTGPYSVVVERAGIIMYVSIISSSPALSLPYYVVGFSAANENNTVESVMNPSSSSSSSCESTRIYYTTGGGALEFTQGSPSRPGVVCSHNTFEIPVASSDRDNNNNNNNNNNIFLRLDPDGNVRTYVYRLKYGWEIDQEIFSPTLYCHLPSRCGSYGVCTSHGSCACPLVVNTTTQQPNGVSGQLFRANNPSDPSQGCALSQPPMICPRNGPDDSSDNYYFVELVGASYFANDYVHQGTTQSLDQCKSRCASACNCTVGFYEENSGNCYTYAYAMTIKNVSDPSLRAFVKVSRNAALGISSNPMQLPSVTIVLIVVSSVLMCVLVASFTLLGPKIRRRFGARHEEEDDDAFLQSLQGLPTRFAFKELYKATGDFRRRIGSGGFGAVYEGNLPDGTMVAVKRLDSAKQGHKEFHAEIATLGSINHINLVRLRGFCTQRSQCLLVYDHMAHGSLDRWLFSGSKVLDWPTRRSIALDTARGLAFLHEESRECIVHLDIKPQNILLDLSFVAKLSDFGLSKLMNREETDIVTNVRGTPGYVAPEWLLQVGVTSKSDVYSYGMVLLELVSGRRNLDLSRNAFWYFPAWAVIMVEDNKMLEIVDERLKPKTMTSEMVKEVERLIKVAMWCIQEDPNLRPCMSGVVRMLEGNGEVESAPSLLDFAMRTRSSMKAMNSTSSLTTLTSKSFKSDASASTHLSNSVLSAPR